MKKILEILAVSSICLGVLTSPVSAQVSRIYFAGYLGLNGFNDIGFTESSSVTSGDLELDNTTSFAGALGLRLDRNTRVEAELSYRKADFSSADFANASTADMGGDLKTSLVFLSLYRDFEIPRWTVKPYIGAGLGFAMHEGKIIDNAGLAVDAEGDDTGFAWHIGGGLKHRISPEMALTGGYRYIGTTDVGIGSYELDYSGHEFRVGLEWDIGYNRSYGR